MQLQKLVPISLICFIAGLLFFGYQQEFIIVRFKTGSKKAAAQQTITKKTVTLHYYHKEKWQHESVQLIWPQNKALALEYLITNWLTLLETEKVAAKNLSLQTIVLSPGQDEAYISFEKSPFLPEQSIQEKWFWIEGLLKTIKQANLGLQRIRFLVNHKPLEDYHLDFTNSWPINGFLP